MERDQKRYPVELSVFRENTNLTDVVVHCFKKQKPQSYEKYTKDRYYVFQQEEVIYKNFYRRKELRERSPINRIRIKADCSNELRELLMSCKESKSHREYPVSFETFCKYVQVENVNGNENHDEMLPAISHKTYQDYFANEKSRSKLNIKIKPMPKLFKKKFLKYAKKTDTDRKNKPNEPSSPKRARLTPPLDPPPVLQNTSCLKDAAPNLLVSDAINTDKPKTDSEAALSPKKKRNLSVASIQPLKQKNDTGHSSPKATVHDHAISVKKCQNDRTEKNQKQVSLSEKISRQNVSTLSQIQNVCSENNEKQISGVEKVKKIMPESNSHEPKRSKILTSTQSAHTNTITENVEIIQENPSYSGNSTNLLPSDAENPQTDSGAAFPPKKRRNLSVVASIQSWKQKNDSLPKPKVTINEHTYSVKNCQNNKTERNTRPETRTEQFNQDTSIVLQVPNMCSANNEEQVLPESDSPQRTTTETVQIANDKQEDLIENAKISEVSSTSRFSATDSEQTAYFTERTPNEECSYAVQFQMFLMHTNVKTLALEHLLQEKKSETPSSTEVDIFCRQLYREFYNSSRWSNNIFRKLYVRADYAEDILRSSYISSLRPIIRSVEEIPVKFPITDLSKGMHTPGEAITVQFGAIATLDNSPAYCSETNSDSVEKSSFDANQENNANRASHTKVPEKQILETSPRGSHSHCNQSARNIDCQQRNAQLSENKTPKETTNLNASNYKNQSKHESSKTLKVGTQEGQSLMIVHTLKMFESDNFQNARQTSADSTEVRVSSDHVVAEATVEIKTDENETAHASSQNEDLQTISSGSTNQTDSSGSSILRPNQILSSSTGRHSVSNNECTLRDLIQIQSQSLLQPQVTLEMGPPNVACIASKNQPQCQTPNNETSTVPKSIEKTPGAGNRSIKTENTEVVSLKKLKFTLDESGNDFKIDNLSDEIVNICDSEDREANPLYSKSMVGALKALVSNEETANTPCEIETILSSDAEDDDLCCESNMEIQDFSEVNENLVMPSSKNDKQGNRPENRKVKPSAEIHKPVPQLLHNFRPLPLEKKTTTDKKKYFRYVIRKQTDKFSME